MPAIIIAITQGKGGATKTTTSVNLAGALNEKGLKTFVFDWDVEKPDATRWKESGGSINWIQLIDKEEVVKQIEEAKKVFDVIIFDTPPNYEQNAFKAILASDLVIIPTSANYLEQENTKEAIEVPMLAKKPFKLLMSQVKKGTKNGREIVNQVVNQDVCFKTVITARNAVALSPSKGQWVGEFAKNSDSHKQYNALAVEVLAWASELGHTCGISTKEIEHEC